MKNIAFLRRPTLTIAAAVVAVSALAGCSATGAPAATTSAAGSSAVPITPRLQGADNFRDVGGLAAGYPTTDGGHVARGVVYRSNALTLTDTDLGKLASLHITDVIDLRTKPEIAGKPDTPIPGAAWVNDDVLGSTGALATPTFATAADAEKMMDGAYSSMVTSPAARAALADALTRIADADGAVIVHCTAGKDRTGWLSALLLHIAGADQQMIDQNYLLTNQYSRASISATLAGMTEKSGPAAAAAYAPLLGVQQSFLDASYAAADKEYGSVDGYLTKGLGLSAATIAKLKERLTA